MNFIANNYDPCGGWRNHKKKFATSPWLNTEIKSLRVSWLGGSDEGINIPRGVIMMVELIKHRRPSVAEVEWSTRDQHLKEEGEKQSFL